MFPSAVNQKSEVPQSNRLALLYLAPKPDIVSVTTQLIGPFINTQTVNNPRKASNSLKGAINPIYTRAFRGSAAPVVCPRLIDCQKLLEAAQ